VQQLLLLALAGLLLQEHLHLVPNAVPPAAHHVDNACQRYLSGNGTRVSPEPSAPTPVPSVSGHHACRTFTCRSLRQASGAAPPAALWPPQTHPPHTDVRHCCRRHRRRQRAR
jgi:hypothetical protein